MYFDGILIFVIKNTRMKDLGYAFSNFLQIFSKICQNFKIIFKNPLTSLFYCDIILNCIIIASNALF